MTLPPSRNGGTLERAADCLYGECMWFSQPTEIPGEPTLNAEPLRTYNVEVSSGQTDYTRYFPWRAPGSAPVLGSGCGRAGGGPVRMMNGGTAKEFGLAHMDGAELPVVNRTVWRRGETVEVAWAVNANHGGGYSYRLCPSDGELTEACFQRTQLRFAGDRQWLRWRQAWGENESAVTRVEIPRVTASTGTYPVGSEWARVPIPACRVCPAGFDWSGCEGDCAGCCETVPAPEHPRINKSWWRTQDCPAMCGGNGLPGSCPAGQTQFPEPAPGLSSLWSSWLWCSAPKRRRPAHVGLEDTPYDMPCSENAMMKINIVDRVIVPEDLEPGDYVLSWRWDAEQTNQVWQNCGDVTVEAELAI
jgi:hypothetical protein